MTRAMFYTRSDCPLCERAWECFEQAGLAAQFHRMDINRDPELTQKFAWRIPVVVLADGQEFDVALDEQMNACLFAVGSNVGAG